MSECDMIHDMVDIQRTPVYPGGVNRAYLIAVIASPALPLESIFFFFFSISVRKKLLLF